MPFRRPNIVKHQPGPTLSRIVCSTESVPAAKAHLTTFADAAAVEARSGLRSVRRVPNTCVTIS